MRINEQIPYNILLYSIALKSHKIVLLNHFPYTITSHNMVTIQTWKRDTLSPFHTIILSLVTLFIFLPFENRKAKDSLLRKSEVLFQSQELFSFFMLKMWAFRPHAWCVYSLYSLQYRPLFYSIPKVKTM